MKYCVTFLSILCFEYRTLSIELKYPKDFDICEKNCNLVKN